MAFSLSQAGYSHNEIFISHAGPQKNFARLLRRRFVEVNSTAFVDEDDIPRGSDGDLVMQDACKNVKLFVFILTRDFLSRPFCMQELRWALDRKRHNTFNQQSGNSKLPELLPLFYRTGQDDPICFEDVKKLKPDLDLTPDFPRTFDQHLTLGLVELLNMTVKPQNEMGLRQRLDDLTMLTKYSCIRLNSASR